MSYNPNNPNGQATKANSSPVTVASDQGPLYSVITSPNAYAASLVATVSAYGYLRTTGEPGMVFADGFDGGTVDTTNRWNTVTGTVTQATGQLTVGNTTISTTHKISSRPTFPPIGLNFNVLGFVATLESSPLTTNVARFFGFGTHSGSPSAATPVTDGYGFEFDGAGHLYASVWVNGSRTGSVDISASAVAGPTRYGMLVRSDLVIFYIGSTEVPVASISYVTPAVQSLPVVFQQINQGTVTGSPSTKIGAAAVHDTGSNSTTISDGSYPWREATVVSDGEASYGLGVVQLGTNFITGVGNTSTAQLGAGATFTGSVESIFNQQAISLLLTSDQNGTLTLNQYIDSGGTRKAATITFSITAGVGFSRSLVANGNYFNLTFQNNGGSTTTTLNINTFYGTLQPSTNRANIPISIDEINGTNFLPTTKNTQVTAAIPVQDIKDSGRTHINLFATAAAAGTTTTETAITLTKSAGTSATTTGTSFVITNGKTFRITAISVATRGNATATIQTTTFNLRMNTAGAVTTTSTPILLSARSATPATASAWDRVMIPIPDGFEIQGNGTIQIGMTAAATYTTNAPTWDVTIIGYEY